MNGSNFDPSAGYGMPNAGSSYPQQWQQAHNLPSMHPQQQPFMMQPNYNPVHQQQPYQQHYYQSQQQFYQQLPNLQQQQQGFIPQSFSQHHDPSMQPMLQPHLPRQPSMNLEQPSNASMANLAPPPLPVEPSPNASGHHGSGSSQGGGTIAAIKAEIARKRKAMAEASAAAADYSTAAQPIPYQGPEQALWPPSDPPPLPQEIDEHQALDMQMRQQWAASSNQSMPQLVSGNQSSAWGTTGAAPQTSGPSSLTYGSTTAAAPPIVDSPPPLPPPLPSTSHDPSHVPVYGQMPVIQPFQLPHQQHQLQAMYQQQQQQQHNHDMQYMYQQQQQQQQQQQYITGAAWTGQQYNVPQYPGASGAGMSTFSQSNYAAAASAVAASQGVGAPHYPQPYPGFGLTSAGGVQSGTLVAPALQSYGAPHIASVSVPTTSAASAPAVMDITPVAIDARKLLHPPGKLSLATIV